MEDHLKKEILDVYLHGQPIGRLYSDNATLSFAYNPEYLDGQNASKLSASLPLTDTVFDHQVTSAFFSRLLPDGDVRTRLARYLGISEKKTFALLKEIGGECAGAVSVYPQGTSPEDGDKPTYRVLDDNEAAEILTSLDKRPLLAGEKDVRISGASAQDKPMICFVGGKVAIPTGNTLSTHIIKPAPRGDRSGPSACGLEPDRGNLHALGPVQAPAYTDGQLGALLGRRESRPDSHADRR